MADESIPLERKHWMIVSNGKPVFHVGSIIVDLDTGAQWIVEEVSRHGKAEHLTMVKGSFTKGVAHG